MRDSASNPRSAGGQSLGGRQMVLKSMRLVVTLLRLGGRLKVARIKTPGLGDSQQSYIELSPPLIAS